MADNINPEADELDIVISATFEKASKAISALKSEILGINKTFGQIDTDKIAKNLLTSTDKALGRVNKDIGKQKVKVEFSTEDAQKKISELRKKFTDIGKDYKPKGGTVDSLVKEQEKWQKRLEQYKDKEARTLSVGGNINTTAFANMQYEISKASNVLGVLDAKIKSVREEIAKTQSISKTSNVKALLGVDNFSKKDIFEYLDNFKFGSQEFNQAKDNLMIAIQDDAGGITKEWVSANQYANEYIDILKRIEAESGKVEDTPRKSSYSSVFSDVEKDKIARSIANPQALAYTDVYGSAEIGKKGRFNADEITDSLKSAIGATNEEASDVSNLRNEFERMKQSIPYIGSKIKEAIGSGTSKQWDKMSKSAKKYGNALWTTLNPIKKVSNSLKDLGKRIKGSRIVSAFIYSWVNGTIKQLANAIKQGIVDGSKNLVQYSDEYNKSISSMRSALLTLKNAFAVGFAPITNVVAPYIAKFINMLANAMNMTGQFFGALTGKKYVVQASKVWEDYGASLDETSESANKLSNQLQGFDKLNNLTTSSSSGSGSGSGSSVSIEDMFTTEEINTSVSEFAQKIQDAWNKTDFTEIGGILGTKLKEQLEHVNDDIFPDIKKFSSKFGKSLATGINGLVTTPSLGKEIGESIANVLITGINFSYEFFKNTNFKAIGDLIGDTINGFFDEMGKTDNTGLNGWQKMGKTFTNRMAGILEMITAALEKVDWNKVGQAIGDYFSAIDWGRIVLDMGKLAVAIGKALISALGSWFETDPLSATIITGIGLAKLIGLNGIFSEKIIKSFGSGLSLNIPLGEVLLVAGSAYVITHRQEVDDAIIKFFGDLLGEDGEEWVDKHEYNLLKGEFYKSGDTLARAVGMEYDSEEYREWIEETAKEWYDLGLSAEDAQEKIGTFLDNGYWGGKATSGLSNGKVFSNLDKLKTKTSNALKGISSTGKATSNSLTSSNQNASNSFSKFGSSVTKTTQTSKTDLTSFVQVASNGYMTFGSGTDTASSKVSGFTSKSSLFSSMGLSILKGMTNGVSGVNSLSGSLGTASSKSDTLNSKSGRTFNVYSGVGGLNSALVGTDGNARTLLARSGSTFNVRSGVGGLTTALSGTNDTANNLLGKSGQTFNVYSGVGTIAYQLGNMASNLSTIFGKNGKTLTFSIVATAKSIASKGLWGYIFGKADGGSFYGGTWHKIDQYASGGVPNYGTHFIAGERGPEVVGHINGRSEVLNQSQMASVMYDAVVAGMTTAMRNTGGSNVSIQIDGREVFRAVRKQDNQYKNVNGHSAFAY